MLSKNIFTQFFIDLDNLTPDTIEEYLLKLPQYKIIIDKTPNKFLAFHLSNAIKNEQFELAEYISQTAKTRNFIIINQPIKQ